MSESKEIPNGWEIVKVDSIGNLLRGITYKKNDATGEPKEGYLPILRANNINGELNFSDLIYVPNKYVEDEQIIKNGDIVFAMSSGSKHLVGKSAVAKHNFNGSYGAFCSLLRVTDALNKNFIAYIFKGNAYRKLISEIAKGTNINNLKRGHILDFEISLPPLPEQHRIVAKIEELFSRLDKGIESLKTAQQQLKVYRQAVLKWAFEGKLTNTEKIKTVKFGDVIKIVSGNTPKGLEDVSNTGKFPFYKVSDMNLIGNEVEMKKSKLTLTKNEIDKLKVKFFPKGTVIFPKRGGAILTNKKRILSVESAFDLNLMGALPNENINGKYLFYWFQKLDLCKIYDGSNVPQINNKNIEPLEFQTCSIKEQHTIVAAIESRLSVCDKLEESITHSLKQAEALRQSILKKAFEGKLVPQDPWDEPASKLLERIKADREALKKKK